MTATTSASEPSARSRFPCRVYRSIALAAQDLEHGLGFRAVNHDGDSDSTGTMAGNLLGAMMGVEAIPRCGLEPLELKNVIGEVAENLYTFKDWRPIRE